MYRDCYTMKLAYPCEADGCRCGSGCLRTRPDCNRTADEDSYSNCDVIPHSGLHTIERWRNRHPTAGGKTHKCLLCGAGKSRRLPSKAIRVLAPVSTD